MRKRTALAIVQAISHSSRARFSLQLSISVRRNVHSEEKKSYIVFKYRVQRREDECALFTFVFRTLYMNFFKTKMGRP